MKDTITEALASPAFNRMSLSDLGLALGLRPSTWHLLKRYPDDATAETWAKRLAEHFGPASGFEAHVSHGALFVRAVEA